MSIVLFIIIILFNQSKRLPIGLIAIVLSVYIILSPIKSDYRKLTWEKGDFAGIDPYQKVQLLAYMANERYTNPNYPQIENDSTAARSAHIFLFSRVVKDTPDKVPYWGGESYLPIFTSFIPRFIFPWKAEERVGQDFGHRYHLLDESDETTSINLPIIVEMYANFGEFGVYFGMAILGIILAFLDRKFNSSAMQTIENVAGTVMIFPLAYQESNFSVTFGGIFLTFIGVTLIFQFFFGSSRRKNFD